MHGGAKRHNGEAGIDVTPDALFAPCTRLDVCQKSISINPSENAVIWVRGVLQQAYSMVVPDAAQANSLRAGARADFDKVLNAEKDSKKRETLVKERELLDGSFSPCFLRVLPVVACHGACPV